MATEGREDVHDLTDFDHVAAKLVLVVCNRSCWEVMALSVVLDLDKRDCSVREGVSGFKVAPILALALKSLYLSPHRKVGARVSRLSYSPRANGIQADSIEAFMHPRLRPLFELVQIPK
jgi:hypothetical protein